MPEAIPQRTESRRPLGAMFQSEEQVVYRQTGYVVGGISLRAATGIEQMKPTARFKQMLKG